MRRFSIGKLMAFIALVAANFWAVRTLVVNSFDVYPTLLIGFLPLADALAIAVYCVASRYRFAVRREPGPGRFAPRFVAIGLPLLLLAIAAWWFAPEPIIDYIEWLGTPMDRFLRSLGIDTRTETSLLRYGILPGYLGLILSGPPLLLTSVLAAFASRYRIVVTPRDGATP